MIYIKLVGSITDRDQYNDIETIAKVFVVERRINNLTYNLNPEDIISYPPLNPKRKNNDKKNSYNANLSIFTVHGLN
jgi:hypothetical protein